MSLTASLRQRLRSLAPSLGVLLLFQLPACMVRDSRPVQYADLQKRAAFDLRCEGAELKIAPIKEHEGSSCTTEFHAAQVAGVTCRDQRSTYIYANGQWIMNSESAPAK